MSRRYVHVYIQSLYCPLQVIPEELRSKWQKDVDALDSKLGGTPDKPISSLLLMLETPQEMVVVCTAGLCSLPPCSSTFI